MAVLAAHGSLTRRVAAYALDVLVACIAIVVLQALLRPVNPLLDGSGDPTGGALHAWVTLTVTLPLLAYFGTWWSSAAGASPGMRFMGLRVRSAAGGRLSPGRSFLRAAVLLVPFEVNHVVLFHPTPMWAESNPGFRTGFLVVYGLLALYLLTAWRMPGRQAPHDIVAGSVVERAHRVA